jgi:WD40 repeat protein
MAKQGLNAGDHVVALGWLPGNERLLALPSEGAPMIVDRASESIVRTLEAHGMGNTCASVSPKAQRVATGGQDGKVRIWDADSGAVLHELDGGAPWIEQCAFSPDGRHLATAAGRILRIWDADGGLVREWSAHASTIATVCWRPDGNGIGVGCYGGVRLYRLRDEGPYEVLDWKGSIISLAWSPNARYVAGGSQESTIQFWKLPHRPGTELFMSGYATKIRELAWDRDSRYLASGGGEIVTIWDVSGKGPAGTRPIQIEGHTEKISELAFQNRGRLLASGGADGCVLIHDHSARVRVACSVPCGAAVSKLAWASDDTALAFGASDGSVTIWRPKY